MALDVELAAPEQGRLQAGDGVGFVPFRGAEVAQEAFARQPEAFAVREGGFGRSGMFGGRG